MLWVIRFEIKDAVTLAVRPMKIAQRSKSIRRRVELDPAAKWAFTCQAIVVTQPSAGISVFSELKPRPDFIWIRSPVGVSFIELCY